MNICYSSPGNERENDPLFLSACEAFATEKYIEAAKGCRRAYSFLGDLYMALEYLKRTANFDLKSALAFSDLGNNAMMRNEVFEAIEWFKKAINLGKDRPEYYIQAAQCYIQVGDYSNAERLIKGCLKKNPGNPTALDYLSKLSYLS